VSEPASDPPQVATTFCAGSPKETQNKLVVTEDRTTPVQSAKEGSVQRVNRDPTRRNDERGRLTRG